MNERTIAVPAMAVGLKLYRCRPGEADPVPCEAVRFPGGAPSVEMVLRRAAISGRVEIHGEVESHFADILDEGQDILATVALDARSYRALKTKWMLCKVAPLPRTTPQSRTAEQEI